MNRYTCPCCGYLTLDERGAYDICYLCDWQDDRQDDPDADQVRGGPNGHYSLTEARANFKKFLTMYREGANTLRQTDQELKAKKAIIEAFEQLKTASDGVKSTLWQQIVNVEHILHDIVHERTERYSNNIEKNIDSLKLINSEDRDTQVNGLLALAYQANDWEFAQERMIRYSEHPDENIRGIAILCFGHIARIHGMIDQALVMPILNKALYDESAFVRGHAESALDDIRMFCQS
ncbi:CPCC family cysteine-rich protein [Paenibacillus wenxiniae]|uniref:CPCC family cysteine-rich protein n=1 Tax=Paenibacillus wenxiniae TaxID=1636843 RepID=A0ABW4RPJ5_9BACL